MFWRLCYHLSCGWLFWKKSLNVSSKPPKIEANCLKRRTWPCFSMQGMLRATVDQLARGRWDMVQARESQFKETHFANPVHTILSCKGKECTIMICQGWPAPHSHVLRYCYVVIDVDWKWHYMVLGSATSYLWLNVSLNVGGFVQGMTCLITSPMNIDS